MLFRAVFWIGLVSVLMPHEPDLGYGRPDPSAALSSGLVNWAKSEFAAKAAATSDVIETTSMGITCQKHATTCSAYAPMARLQANTVRSLAQVKAEIAAARHPNL